MDSRQPPHILLVAFPIQSHINPALQFVAHLLRSGAHVTLATTVAGAKRMNKSGGAAPACLSFATISDGYDDGFKPSSVDSKPTTDNYMISLKRRGSETLSDLIAAGPPAGSPPYTCVVYTIILSWVADVARLHSLPSALLWIQNATLFAVYYYYFNGYGDVIDKCDENDPEWTVKLPSLPPLHARDLPSFLAPSNPYTFADVSFREQFEECKRPFLWVIRKSPDEENDDVDEVTSGLKGLGMVVTWCSQVEVLAHKAVGCFVTHCGWNSTLESLTAGVAVVGVPQWTDQLTNAWMLESAWGVGVRVSVEGTVAEEKVVGREELRRRVEEVMGSGEMRANARRWREEAVVAVREGGSSEVNVRAFVEEVWRMSRTRFDVNQEELVMYTISSDLIDPV